MGSIIDASSILYPLESNPKIIPERTSPEPAVANNDLELLYTYLKSIGDREYFN